MEMKQMLGKLSKILAFSSLGLSIYLSSCFSYNPDFENQIWINNTTIDTLYFQVTKKYIREDSYVDEIFLAPGLNRIGGLKKYKSLEIIEREYKYRGDTVEIYRNGELFIKWAAPFREMPDSVHHFFNKNSWEIKMGGHKDEWEIATFTITEEDFEK